ncbi:TerB family tellurite resistance protein [Paracoccus sp. S1E-3]|uniref:tellurite resistance TerB family protein n=1 Tax=Paracoccus sp. S1E-3 TaxID=2756130 RepID=UPI0015EE676F|nr:TerB family tellurite resistance protein [Paracoccus sp. S1E-3]MBA4490481.1 TerB family tellurite resistance protein [Paracoccus sp. S1E-3]
MFRNLMSRLFSQDPPSAPLRGQDAEVALAALLVRIARADERYTREEAARIDQILARRRGLDANEAAERRVAAEMIEAEAPDTVRFTRLIKDRIALEDRTDIIAALWEIAYADGNRTPDEESLVRLVAGLLGINDRDSGLIRQRVIAELGLAQG